MRVFIGQRANVRILKGGEDTWTLIHGVISEQLKAQERRSRASAANAVSPLNDSG